MRIKTLGAVAATAITLMGSASAAGQTTEDRWRVGMLIGLTKGNGGLGQTAGVTFTYRLAPRLLIEGEAAFVTNLDFGAFPFCPPGVACFRGGSFALHRRGMLMTGHLVAELPAVGRWLRPYAVAGGGYARLRREQEDLTYPDWQYPVAATQAPVFALGGGLLIPMSRRLLIRADARYQLVFHERPRMFFRTDIRDRFQWLRLSCSIDARF